MKNSLISVSKLISEGLKVEFDKDGCKVNNVHGTLVAQARREKNLYLLNVIVRKEGANVAKSSNEGATLWHQRLGHLNMASFKKLENMVNGMNLKEVPLHHVCKGCIEGKHQRYWKQLENKQEVKHSRFMKMEQLYSPTRRLQR
jgi:hypothetical protein